MATKYFMPKGARVTKKNIFAVLVDDVRRMGHKIGFKLKDLTDRDCQQYVDEDYALQQEYIDLDEGDLVEYRIELSLAIVNKVRARLKLELIDPDDGNYGFDDSDDE